MASTPCLLNLSSPPPRPVESKYGTKIASPKLIFSFGLLHMEIFYLVKSYPKEAFMALLGASSVKIHLNQLFTFFRISLPLFYVASSSSRSLSSGHLAHLCDKAIQQVAVSIQRFLSLKVSLPNIMVGPT